MVAKFPELFSNPNFSLRQNNSSNDTVLLLFDAQENLLKEIEKTLIGYEDNFTIIKYYNRHSFNIENDGKKYIILNISCNKLNKEYTYVNTLYEILSKGVFLYVPKVSIFYTDFPSYCNTQNYDISEIDTRRYLYYIGKFKPYEFIKKHSQKDIELFMDFTLKHGLISLFEGDRDKYLYKQINVPEYDIKKLFIDLEVFKSKNILTSRLGVVIYRMINNIKTSTTSIGRYFHECTGSQSKPVKLILDTSATSDFYKVYDLNINDSELTIRKEIAKELIALNIKRLDSNKIAKITKLPNKIIEKMIK